MAGARVLVAMAEPDLGRLLRTVLLQRGFDVKLARNGDEVLALVERRLPDVILLDLELPGTNGLEICAIVRYWCCTPIIALSTEADEAQKVRVFDLGVDDYVTKPFGLDELSVRVRVALRDAAGGAIDPEALIGNGDLRVDFQARRVWRGDTQIELTPMEYDLLRYLVQHRDRDLLCWEVTSGAWGVRHAGERNYLRRYIPQLRNKLELDPKHPRYLLTNPGAGIRFRSG
jgi:two-component system, OmpR family, KDP operon response regulator KdpE